MRNFLLMLLFVPAFSFAQVNLNAGLIANFTPTSTMGFDVGASYQMYETRDVVGIMIMDNNYKAYYIPYYGSKIGKQTRILAGMNFVNDYSGDKRVLKQTYMMGFNYDFKKVRPDDIFNFYAGFVYTNQYVLLRAGFNLDAWGKKRKKQ